MRFDSIEQLKAAIETCTLQLGIDQIALVQNSFRRATARLRGWKRLAVKFLYAINILVTGESFNLCPAELCQIESVAENPGANTAGLKVESFTPPRPLIDAVEKIVAAAGIDAGGVEYMIDDRDGRAVFYDINALSNFVATPRASSASIHISNWSIFSSGNWGITNALRFGYQSLVAGCETLMTKRWKRAGIMSAGSPGEVKKSVTT